MSAVVSGLSQASAVRIVIVGGNAGGATCAARLSRLSSKADIHVLESGSDVSFANCGLPYHIGNEIPKRSALCLQTAESLTQSLGIRVSINSRVTGVDAAAQEVLVAVSSDNGLTTSSQRVPYNKLLLAPGSAPIVPNVPGKEDPRLMTLRTLHDMDRIISALKTGGTDQRITIVGAGFIGLELVEQVHRLGGKRVTLVEAAPHVLPQADEEMSSFLHPLLKDAGIDLVLGDGLTEFLPSPDSLGVKLRSGRIIQSDLVLLGIGVCPEGTDLAKCAGLKLGMRGSIAVNEFMQTSDPNIYAVGDAVEVKDHVFAEEGDRSWVALGNIANTQARIAADHMLTGKSVAYPGNLGTSIVRCFDLSLGLTGWSERRLKQLKKDKHISSVIITNADHASYYPGFNPLTVKLIFDAVSGVIYGGQVCGKSGVDKRVDALASAIFKKQTIDELSQAQFSYAPPFGSARDPLVVAALAARNVKDGILNPAYALPTRESGEILLDVRGEPWAPDFPLPAPEGVPVVRIPFREIKQRIHELDKTKKYITVCNWGRASYFAHRDLFLHGFNSPKTLVGGARIHFKGLIPSSDGEENLAKFNKNKNAKVTTTATSKL